MTHVYKTEGEKSAQANAYPPRPDRILMTITLPLKGPLRPQIHQRPRSLAHHPRLPVQAQAHRCLP